MTKFLAIISLLTLLLVTSPSQAFAADILRGVDCSKAADSTICNNPHKGNPLTGSDGLLIKITDIVSYIAGAAAVIVIIVGALRFVTAGGDSGSVATARKSVINALLGLLIIALAHTIIIFVIKKFQE